MDIGETHVCCIIIVNKYNLGLIGSGVIIGDVYIDERGVLVVAFPKELPALTHTVVDVLDGGLVCGYPGQGTIRGSLVMVGALPLLDIITLHFIW
jgi:hypothetical protein